MIRKDGGLSERDPTDLEQLDGGEGANLIPRDVRGKGSAVGAPELQIPRSARNDNGLGESGTGHPYSVILNEVKDLQLSQLGTCRSFVAPLLRMTPRVCARDRHSSGGPALQALTRGLGASRVRAAVA
jgi:hypothetical protein